MKQLVSLIHSGKYGRSPFDPTLWSSISRRLFSLLRDRGRLHRALGIELPPFRRLYHFAANFRPNRHLWRSRFYMNPSYRQALTHQAAAELATEDFRHHFLQIGAMFDIPSVLNGRARCYSYHDGSLAELLNSPLRPINVRARLIDRALAFEKRIYHGMEKVFTFSEYLRRSMIEHYSVPEDRIVVIGAGINLDTIPEPNPDKDCDNREVLFIGVDFARKGGCQLLKAFASVRERWPDAVLHVVGPRQPPPHARDAAGVVWHGFLGRQVPDQAVALDRLFRKCSLFVMPSLYEPFGIAPLEAMAYQIPCLVTNGWALPEFVKPGETGDLVALGSVEDLREKLLKLLSDPAGLRRMGARGRELVLQRYVWDGVVDRLAAQIATN